MSTKKKFATLYKSSRYSAVKGRAQEVQRRAAQFSQITGGRKHPPNRRVAAALRAYTAVCASLIRFSPSPTVLQSTRAFSELSYNILTTAEYKDTAILDKCVWVIVVCHCCCIYIAHFYSAIFRVCVFFSRGYYYVSNSIGQCIRFPTRSIKLVD